MKWLITIVFWSFISVCQGQTEHNFTMGPNNSTCDSLIAKESDPSIELIRKTKFRVSEELKISRYKSPRQVWYFSCDGELGFLIAKEAEDVEVLLDEVKKEDWDALLNAKDPVSEYNRLKARYSQ